MNKSVTKYIFPHKAFPAEHDGNIYFHVQLCLQKLEGLLQHHVSPFIPPSPVLSQYILFYEVRRNIKRFIFRVVSKVNPDNLLFNGHFNGWQILLKNVIMLIRDCFFSMNRTK